MLIAYLISVIFKLSINELAADDDFNKFFLIFLI